MPKSEHSYYLMKCVPKDDYWRFFTQLMYDTIDTLADDPEEVIVKVKAYEARLQMDDDLEAAAIFLKLWTKSDKQRQPRKSWKSRGSGSESDGSSSESEKHRRRHTQECYRCHKVGHIARYCPSTAQVESAAQTETAAAAAAAAATTTTSIENYWMTVTGRSPEKEAWYLHCATTSHICGDRQEFIWYTEYAKRDEREIHDFAGRVTAKAIGYGDVRLRLRLPGYHRNHEVVVRNVLHIEGAHNSLSQSRLMDGGCRLCLSTAMRSRYTTKCRETVLEVEEVLWSWHSTLEGNSDWMWSGWMWRLQERGIEREDNCLGGASGKLYLCFLWSLALRSWYRPGGVWGRIWVLSSRGLV